MVEVADRAVEAAWKIKNLPDFDRRLERAARGVDERSGGGGLAAMVVYETALMKSGRPTEEVREKVRAFRGTFEDEEEPLSIAHASGLMSVAGAGGVLGEGGRPGEEVVEKVRACRGTVEDEEGPLSIAHAGGIMSVEGDDWFFGDRSLRVLTGKLLGQFQHRGGQYNHGDDE